MSQYIKPLEQCLHTRRMEDKRRIGRFILAALFMALWGWSAAQQTQDATCGDSCVAERLGCYDLPPDHPDYNDVDACIFGPVEEYK